MKNFLVILLMLTLAKAHSATCSNTTRTNYVTNQILTSSALNADFNQLVTKLNAFDGGCVTDGTLEFSALNTSDFGVLLKGVHQGCKVEYSNASTVTISECFASVNGNLVTTAGNTSVSMGCGSCSAEATGTTYYVYIANGSTGSTLTPLLLTTAPNENGYDNSNNKVVGRLYNNASGDIGQYSIDQWQVNAFSNDNLIKVSGYSKPKACVYAFGGGSATLASPTECTTGTCVEVFDSCGTASPPAFSATGIYIDLTFPAGTWANSSLIHCDCKAYDTTTGEPNECVTYFITGDNTWSTTSTGGAVLNIVANGITGTTKNSYISLNCLAEAP